MTYKQQLHEFGEEVKAYELKTGELNYLDIVKDHYNRNGLGADNYEWEVKQGRGRYNKVVATAKFGASRHAVAFIDKQTSHVLNAASWSAPARTRIA